MALQLADLDFPGVRAAALAEVKEDTDAGRLYRSKRFNDRGRNDWRTLLEEALRSGTDETLEFALRAADVFASHEESRTKNAKVILKAVPHDAAKTLAEGEFNRFYIRGLCRVAISGSSDVTIYRAKAVTSPRRESEAAIGRRVDPTRLLNDLRTSIGIETALGIPPGPNSGLSVRLQEHK